MTSLQIIFPVELFSLLEMGRIVNIIKHVEGVNSVTLVPGKISYSSPSFIGNPFTLNEFSAIKDYALLGDEPHLLLANDEVKEFRGLFIIPYQIMETKERQENEINIQSLNHIRLSRLMDGEENYIRKVCKDRKVEIIAERGNYFFVEEDMSSPEVLEYLYP